jgi:hypothetical protein
VSIFCSLFGHARPLTREGLPILAIGKEVSECRAGFHSSRIDYKDFFVCTRCGSKIYPLTS